MVDKTNWPGRRRSMAGYSTADMQTGRDYLATRVPAEVKDRQAQIDAAREQKPAKPPDDSASS